MCYVIRIPNANMAATARDNQELAKDQRERESERGLLIFECMDMCVCVCVCERESLFRFQSSKVKKDSQPEPESESESEQTESTSKTLVVVVAIVRCICKYVPTTEAIQSEYVTNQCPNERPRRVRNAAACLRL